ncbi:hypothetical protein T45_06516 [Streptomyces turgidiscabies]|nr:hypothetical protein T45_06516 [Streptomyces turgidiscabies]
MSPRASSPEWWVYASFRESVWPDFGGSAVMGVDMFGGLSSIRRTSVSEWLTKFRTITSL